MELFNYIALILSLAISTCSLVLVYTYRKKEFQIIILKEQIAAYHTLVEILFHNWKRINEVYDEIIDLELAMHDIETFESVIPLQTFLYKQKFASENNDSFNRFQNLVFLLPEDVIQAVVNYFDYLHNLFEKENDFGLAQKLAVELNQKVYEVINVIRNHTGVDDLAIDTRRIISKRPQLQFVKELV